MFKKSGQINVRLILVVLIILSLALLIGSNIGKLPPKIVIGIAAGVVIAIITLVRTDIALGIIIFSMLLLRVRLSARAVELAYEIERLATEKKSQEEENRKLALEVARLRSPERISKIAVRDLNMVRAADTEVVTLERQSDEVSESR